MTHDGDVFTKMDPMAQMEFVSIANFKGEAILKTLAHQSAGKNPVWNKSFEIPLKITPD